ncbi:MAG: ATP-binding protein [candidate division Zixibacteria bacterium]|nr:ATP-binding protein [candidate division Zixibacteria bacterium]
MLVIDEVGYLSLDRNKVNLIFQLIVGRYEKGSIILTSNKTFVEWGEVFGDKVLVTALLDRLMHHAEVLAIKGQRYRLRGKKLDGSTIAHAAEINPTPGKENPKTADA